MLGIAGCSSHRPGSAGPAPTPVEVYRSLLGHNQGLTSLRAVAEARLSFAGREVSLPGVLMLDSFGGFRLDLLDPLDRPLAILFADGGRIVHYRPGPAWRHRSAFFPRGVAGSTRRTGCSRCWPRACSPSRANALLIAACGEPGAPWSDIAAVISIRASITGTPGGRRPPARFRGTATRSPSSRCGSSIGSRVPAGGCRRALKSSFPRRASKSRWSSARSRGTRRRRTSRFGRDSAPKSGGPAGTSRGD